MPIVKSTDPVEAAIEVYTAVLKQSASAKQKLLREIHDGTADWQRLTPDQMRVKLAKIHEMTRDA